MQTPASPAKESIRLLAPVYPKSIWTPAALEFITELVRRFEPGRALLLEKRKERQAAFDAGALPDFLPETHHVRQSDWTIDPIPADLLDRRVEITGPVERKMIINALNSGASAFMADFEDATTPSWENLMQGQVNLRDAVRGDISFTNAAGKKYSLQPQHAVLIVRPRGWHLPEIHLEYQAKPVAGGLVDFGLFLLHNHAALQAQGTRPYFYLPKLQSHLEARLWCQIIDFAEDYLGIARGTVKVTVLIETLPAAFEMDEILYELRQHIVALNCGRWDYIFSYIKCFARHADKILPDRDQITMDKGFLRAYSQLLIRTCHRRGALAIGGMAAHIPVKDNPNANREAFSRVRQDKEREAGDGHDGTWIAHPGLQSLAREVFDQHMPGPNQLDKLRLDVDVQQTDLLKAPSGSISMAGLRGNLEVALRYLAAWLGGQGCVPIHNLMEDAATAEIARAQVWQWLNHKHGSLQDGTPINQGLVNRLVAEIHAALKVGSDPRTTQLLEDAARLLNNVLQSDDFVPFITLPAYALLGCSE